MLLNVDSVTISNNGGSVVVSVRLNGLTGAANIQPVSSEWSDLAVFPQPATDAESGAFKYEITSISKRTGTYEVVFKSSCGSKTVRVQVK